MPIREPLTLYLNYQMNPNGAAYTAWSDDYIGMQYVHPPQYYSDQIRDRIRRDVLAEIESKWYPIDQLEPMDHERIIGCNNTDPLYWEYSPYMAYWDARAQFWRLVGDPEVLCIPTHFMEYPSAPEMSEA